MIVKSFINKTGDNLNKNKTPKIMFYSKKHCCCYFTYCHQL